MNRFARWVVKHRVVVVIICLALMIPSIFGMASTRVKYDLLYYLPEELDTIKGQNILMEDFGKGAFSLCITEGLNEVDQADLEESIRGIPHVETVCLLSKLNAKQHIEVDIHMDELDLTDAEKKATYSEIKEYVLEHTGLKVSNLYIAQVKQKCGIIERENYNKPKSDDAKQPQCPPDKEKAIKEALKHFGMI